MKFFFYLGILGISNLICFAANADVCGKIQKLQQNKQSAAWEVTLDSGKTLPVFVGMADGITIVDSIVTTALASNLTVCFSLQPYETLYGIQSVSK